MLELDLGIDALARPMLVFMHGLQNLFDSCWTAGSAILFLHIHSISTTATAEIIMIGIFISVYVLAV